MITVEEAHERWPEEWYDPDTLGGMRRKSVEEYWRIRAEVIEQADNDALTEHLLSDFDREMTRYHDLIDAMQLQGLRTSFKAIMGYELPE